MTEPPPPQDDQAPPRWPAWTAPVSFVVAFAVLLVLVPVAAQEAHPLAGLGGGVVGIVLGLILARLPQR